MLVDLTKVKHIKSFVANLYNGLQDLSLAICIESKNNLSQSKYAKNELDGSPFSSQQSHRMHFLWEVIFIAVILWVKKKDY